MPGPIPNRESDLARPRARKGGDQMPVIKGTLRPLSEALEPDPNWEPIAIELYESLFSSGQSDYYQDSDIALAWSLCDDLSYAKRSPKRSGQLLQTIYSGLERLAVAYGDRMRLRLELSTPPPEEDDAEVVAMDAYRDRIQGRSA